MGQYRIVAADGVMVLEHVMGAQGDQQAEDQNAQSPGPGRGQDQAQQADDETGETDGIGAVATR